jgi:hypothetical protein
VSPDELRPAYRTLNEPSRLFGLSLATILALAAAGGLGYAWLLVSPLPWRANVSTAVIGLGAPLVLLVVRESAALSPARLLAAVIRWRARPSTIEPANTETRIQRGAIRLDQPAITVAPPAAEPELPWLEHAESRSES